MNHPCVKCGKEKIIIKPMKSFVYRNMQYVEAAQIELPQEVKCNRKGCKTFFYKCSQCPLLCVSCEKHLRCQIKEVVTALDKIKSNEYNVFNDCKNIVFDYLF